MAIKRGEQVNFGGAGRVFGALLLFAGIVSFYVGSSAKADLDRYPAWATATGDAASMRTTADNAVFAGIALVVIGGVMIAMSVAASRRPQADVNTERRPCPYCAEQIQVNAIKCRFCGSEVRPLESRVEQPQSPAPPPGVWDPSEEQSVLRNNIQQLKGELQSAGKSYDPEVLFELGSQYALLYDSTGSPEHRRAAHKYMTASRETESESGFFVRESTAFGSLMNDPEFADFVS